MRFFFSLVALLFLGTFAPVGLTPPDPPPAKTFISFKAVAAPAETSTGLQGTKLRFLGGWRLESNDWRFGGLSAMHVADGEVLAFSDSGWMIRFRVPVGDGARSARIDSFPADQRASGKSSRDVESLVVHGGHAWLGLERRNGVWRFGRPAWRPESAARPRLMRKWPANSGAEAMLKLPDGRFLVFAEGQGSITNAALFLGDPAVPGTRSIRLRYRPPQGYRITDAAMLPDGRMLLLNRRVRLFQGISSMLATAAVPAGRADELIVAQDFAAPEPTGLLDNMEALSLTRENGRVVVWLASDNDYMPIRPTLLLKLAIEP